MMCLLELVDIHYSYPGHERNALHGVSLHFPPGDRVALIGRNGSGKSTLMLHCNGILFPQQGEVRLGGVTVTSDRASLTNLRRHVGLVLQDPDDQLFSASVAQDISFGPLNLGLSTCEAHARVDEAAALCDVTHLLERPTHALSGGEKTRVALAGVLAMQPSILVADELINSLDPWARQQIFTILDRLVKSGKTVMLATHDMDVAFGWAERVVWMNEGQIYFDGSAVEAQLLFESENPAFAGHVPPRLVKKSKLRL
ncbi:ABC transporter ATP-binding protein, partial [Candidatus Villigracilis vicinus]|uniref:energy-coupling factor ABC transporter ATP-binding protein n=1 Tax=Candidatus Villigracilis vicinus TaxID=3140679 RepID=UPI0031EE3A4D